MTNLQEEANKLAEAVLKRASNSEVTPPDSARPSVSEANSQNTQVEIRLQQATPLSKPDECVEYFKDDGADNNTKRITKQMSELSTDEKPASESEYASAKDSDSPNRRITPDSEEAARRYSAASEQMMDEDICEAVDKKLDGTEGFTD